MFDLSYDASGRLAALDRNGAPEASYGYDAFGRRVFKDPAVGAATHFVYDPDGRLLAESTAAGGPEREYIWLPLDGQAWALPLALVTDAGTAGHACTTCMPPSPDQVRGQAWARRAR